MLSVTNSLTRGRAPLVAPEGRDFTLYSCGPTVYRYAHIGNLRTFLLTDLVRRVLARDGVAVRAVQNITDVGHLTDDTLADSGAEDKLLVQAGMEDRSATDIAAYYTDAYLHDAQRLNLLPFDAYPKATEHIDAMLDLVGRLVAGGHAYDAPSAVYFAVRSFPDYGKLSGNRLDELQPGHRSAPNPDKRFHGDFALWRKAGPRRQMVWPSPWGPGFPGWHIECSAMGLSYLGEAIDLHLGGVDLQFPHHECEIAQSEAVVGHQVVATWLHAEHLLAHGRKMAKSTGNVFDLRSFDERGLDPLAFRLLCLQARYRTQSNFTWEAATAAARTLDRLRTRVAELRAAAPGDGDETATAALNTRFDAAVDDDLDTPSALRLVHAVSAGDADAATLSAAQRVALLRDWDAVLGLDLDLDQDRERADVLPAGAAERLAARERARAARDFAAADRLRDELADLGVSVTDTPDGPRWARTS